MKSTLEKLITEAVVELFGISNAPFTVEHADLTHGDFATNVALVIAKEVGKSPKEVAEAIVSYIADKKSEFVKEVSIAGPGFINFTISSQFFTDILQKVLRTDSWGSNDIFSGKKILVEHSSPNLFKPFHTGHVMNNAIGESIVRLAKYSGAQVTAISYPSDISLGIGKAVWALLSDGEEKLENLQTMDEKLAYLGECYVRGTRAFDEDEAVQAKVREITKQLYQKEDGVALTAYEIGKKINLDYFISIVKRLGSEFDDFIFESEAGETGVRIVRANIPAVFEESEGAVIYRGEQDGLHTRVFINKEGFPVYEAKDIGLISLKFERFHPELSIFITDHEQTSYFEVVLAAAAKIDPKWKERSVHRTHGRMSFMGQKMSSRLGGVPIAQKVLDAIVEEVRERAPELSLESADMIAVSALKFSILRTMAGKNINFDPETSLSFEGDSGPYLQYTAVRAGSVIAKAKEAGILPMVSVQRENTPVERLIARFPDTVTHATTEWAPHYIVTYLLELAQAFNSWYGNTKIFDTESPETAHRLAITQAVQRTLINGLWLLGISVPEKM